MQNRRLLVAGTLLLGVALLGWAVLHDQIHPQAWAGVALATVGLVVLSWPKRDQIGGSGFGALMGLTSGAAFAVTLNSYREAGRALEPAHAIYAGTASVCVAQCIQILILTSALAVLRPQALRAVARSWRPSRGAPRSAPPFGVTAARYKGCRLHANASAQARRQPDPNLLPVRVSATQWR